jgi:hypothetical protein
MLHLAAMRAYVGLCKWIIERGGDPNLRDVNGCTRKFDCSFFLAAPHVFNIFSAFYPFI